RKSLMNTTWSNLMIMPDSQQSQHASRKSAMHSQVRPHNAMPVFDGAARPNGVLPRREQFVRDCLPGRFNTFHQIRDVWAKDAATLPRPAQDMHRSGTQLCARLLL